MVAINDLDGKPVRAGDETEQHWLEHRLSGMTILLISPADYPRPALRTYKSRREDFVLDAELADEVKKLGKSTGSSFVTTLLAAFEVFLQRLTGQDEIILRLPAAGQPATAGYRLVGHCVNSLALIKLSQRAIFFRKALLQKAKSELRFLMPHDHQLYTFGSVLLKN